MILMIAFEALLFVQAGGSAVPGPDDESPRVQAEQRAITEISDIEAKGDAVHAQRTAHSDRHENAARHDGHDKSSTKEADYYEDAGKGSAGGEPAPGSSDLEPK